MRDTLLLPEGKEFRQPAFGGPRKEMKSPSKNQGEAGRRPSEGGWNPSPRDMGTRYEIRLIMPGAGFEHARGVTQVDFKVCPTVLSWPVRYGVSLFSPPPGGHFISSGAPLSSRVFLSALARCWQNPGSRTNIAEFRARASFLASIWALQVSSQSDRDPGQGCQP